MQEDRSMPNKDQPPQLRSYIADAIAKLRTQADEKKPQSLVRQKSAQTKKRIETDYAVLISEWFNSMPPAMRDRRFTTDELLARFSGRYRDKPACRMIAAALRANGFTSHRDWTSAGCNQRYWLPPKV